MMLIASNNDDQSRSTLIESLMKITTTRSCLLASILAAAVPAHALIGISSVSFTEPEPGIVSADDLANADSPDLLSRTSTPFTAVGSANDGTLNASLIDEELTQYPASIEFNFDTVTNPLGYSITSVSTVTGLSQFEAQPFPWSIFFTEASPQFYTLSYRLVGEAAFTDLITVTDLGAAPIRKVTLIGIADEIDGGVEAVRFTWEDPFPTLLTGGLPADESITFLREIDMFGSPIAGRVPEPSAAAITAIAAVGLVAGRRPRFKWSHGEAGEW